MRRSDVPTKTWRFNAGVSDLQAVIGSFALAEASGTTLPPIVADLVEVAGAIHVVDRSVRRPSPTSGNGSWSRQLQVVLGVRRPDVWNSSGVSSLLVDLLTWLTDDVWTLNFVPRQAPAVAAECVQFLFPMAAQAECIALFSGGVDSLAGLALAHEDGHRPMLMSVRSNRRMLANQTEVLEALRRSTGIAAERVGIDLHLDHTPSHEPSQRARGFGFLSLGAALVELCRTDALLVFENGVGAINLPYSAAQAGAHGTRAMHPATLQLAAQLYSALFARRISVVNPNQFRTKAEMCRQLPFEVQQVLPYARSCDTAYATRLSPDSCGACTSCLLRRQALLAAGLPAIDAATDVRFDAFAPAALGNSASYPLRAMLSQAARLAAATAASDPWRSLCFEFPDIVHAASALPDEPNAVRSLSDMYCRYVGEWRSMPEHITAAYLDAGLPAA
jgi:7-cyano-7-deazaguanine synthase in queuosine biosynthesis